MTTTAEATLYIGNAGWTGKVVHAIKPNSGRAYDMNDKLCYQWAMQTYHPITHLKMVQATKDNVTCKNCLKHLQ